MRVIRHIVIILSVVRQNVFKLSVIILSVARQNVFKLSVIILSVVRQNVEAPAKVSAVKNCLIERS